MNLTELIKEIGEYGPEEWKSPEYRYITGLWCQKTDKWISTSDLVDNQNFFIFGDDGGDKFVESFDNETELLKGVQKYYNGNTGADFETSIYLIVQNGEKKTIQVSLK